VPVVDPERRFEIMGEYLRASVRYIGEAPACRMMRSRLGWFAKGLPHAGRFRESVKQIRTEAEGIEKIADYQRIVCLQTEDEATPAPPVT